jgi:hypothetical protein
LINRIKLALGCIEAARHSNIRWNELILSKIINARIYCHFTENNFWSFNQNGIITERRADDNIFILHTIFQKSSVKEWKDVCYIFPFSKLITLIENTCFSIN